jgi:nucleotide-binding universal stress UspA family protein
MLKLIIVPLDGSEFGEQAIPIALHVAAGISAEVELVHVYEAVPPYYTQGAPPLDSALDEALRAEWQHYLERLAERLRRKTPLTIATVVLSGPVGATLAEHVEEQRAELVAAATHGRGGLSRASLGSVASTIVRRACAPVLLIRPSESSNASAPRYPFARVLVPLDGSAEAEEAIVHALRIASDDGVEYLLVHVVMPLVFPLEATGAPVLDLSHIRESAEAYLEDVADRVRERVASVKTHVLEHAHTARAILHYAAESGADLVAMETHGRSGISRLLVGSVADKVARGSRVPVLLHRPCMEEDQWQMS